MLDLELQRMNRPLEINARFRGYIAGEGKGRNAIDSENKSDHALVLAVKGVYMPSGSV